MEEVSYAWSFCVWDGAFVASWGLVFLVGICFAGGGLPFRSACLGVSLAGRRGSGAVRLLLVGGGASFTLVASHRPVRGMCLPDFCFKGAVVAEGWVEGWWLDLARVSRGDVRRRRRVRIQGRRNSGLVPGRWATNDGLFFCGSPQSLCAMEFPSISGRAVAGAGDFRWRGSLESPACIGAGTWL